MYSGSSEKRRKIEQHQSTCQMSVTCDPWSNVHSMYSAIVAFVVFSRDVRLSRKIELNYRQLDPTSIRYNIDRHTNAQSPNA